MATIDIFPLSIDNVKAPLNLLANLITGVNPQYLSYPIDLGSNPQYCHAVQFQIYDYDITGAQDIFNSVRNAANSMQNVGDFFSNFKLPSTGQAAIKANKGSTRAYINLYMPDTLATSYDSDYTTISLTDTFGPLGFLVNAVAGSKGNLEDLKKNLIANGGDLGGYAASKLLGSATDLAGMEGGNIAALIQQKLGVIPNPQMQLIYRGISLRQFQLEFLFSPISRAEAQNVEQIVNTFVHYSLPSIKGGNNGQYLSPPQVFSMKFAFLGGSKIQNAVRDIFKNTLTNVFGSQLTSMLSGSTPESASAQIQNAAEAKVFTVKDCVLSNVNVDYAPNGWASYADGYPVQTRLTLQFQEMEMLTKKDVPVASDLNNSSNVGPFLEENLSPVNTATKGNN